MSENSAPDTARKATAPALLELEHDNLRTAIGSALDARDTLTAARACTSLWRFWRSGGT